MNIQGINKARGVSSGKVSHVAWRASKGHIAGVDIP